VGVWGTDLFSDDLASNIHDHYRKLPEDGIEDAAATRLILEKFRAYLEEPEGIALLAFAVTQSKFGRLYSAIRDRALAVLDIGGDLEVWERENPSFRSVARCSRTTCPNPWVASPRRRFAFFSLRDCAQFCVYPQFLPVATNCDAILRNSFRHGIL
jgi:hypothetical protein